MFTLNVSEDPNEYYYAEYGEAYDDLYYDNQNYDYKETYNYEDANEGKFKLPACTILGRGCV